MSMNATPERAEPPRPAIISLPAAVRTAQESGTVLAEMRLPLWAQSFNCTTDDIMREWERQLTLRSREPSNSFDEMGEGK